MSRSRNFQRGLEKRPKRFGDFVELRIGESVEEGQSDSACAGQFRDGKRPVRQANVSGLQMNRREIATAGDSFGGHGLNDSLTVCWINFVAQSDDVHEPADRFVVVTNERSDQRGLRLKPFVVGERDFAAAREN